MLRVDRMYLRHFKISVKNFKHCMRNKRVHSNMLAIKLRVKKVKNEMRSLILPELLKLDLNLVPKSEEEESS
ncbi:hypothetical protein H5410_045855 [Solanum commersonii]|uniref:Uncharacterized protein n=1 Tax=Solanum commersonii TaxID=4109 RepID=A0A9J5XCR9_SOLCO|nr:hypothetical protein H5410_045855 [Solanum commersonii]